MPIHAVTYVYPDRPAELDAVRPEHRAFLHGLREDGVPTQDIDAQWLGRAGWRPSLNDFKLGWESYGEGADTLWYDDVALGSTRIGC